MTPAALALAACIGPVSHVVDADTFDVACDHATVRIRLADVDAPEMRGPCAARGAAAAWLVRAEFGPWEGMAGILAEIAPRYADRWGRIVANVTIREGVWRGWDMAEAINAAAETLGAKPPLRPWPHNEGRALAPNPWKGKCDADE